MTADKREYEDRDNEKLQTSTYDDFEDSLSRDGIEIIEAERDPDYLPEGIGADEGYLPRLTEPSYTNPYYIHKDGGGYNLCIKIVGQSCLPNCVGYAFGRYLEAAGILSEANLPRCNAEDWFSMAKSGGFPVGSTPRLGAICVWRKGGFWNSHDGCGHVSVVEKIYESGAILVSQSNYGGARFNMATIRPPYNITGQTFVGFIYNPHLTDTSAKGDATIEEIAKTGKHALRPPAIHTRRFRLRSSGFFRNQNPHRRRRSRNWRRKSSTANGATASTGQSASWLPAMITPPFSWR